MGKTRPRFAEEFKAEAVRLVETSGRRRSEIAGELGIDETVLKRWQLRANGGGSLEYGPPGRGRRGSSATPREHAPEDGSGDTKKATAFIA
jgi:transposase